MARNEDCQILAIANQKGGVGKTTTAVNLATGLAAVGKRTLLMDMDPQGNASTGLGVENADRSPNTYDMLIRDIPITDVERKTGIPNLTILPAVVDLAAADVELATSPDREFILKDLINANETHYDYIILDTPPALGLLTINCLAAATKVIIPLQCEFFALEGLSHLLHTIQLVQGNINPELEIEGVVLTMYDRRNRLTTDVEADVRDYMKGRVFNTVIPRNVRVSEAPSHGQPAIIYDFRCPGSQAYLHLARELLQRMETRTEEAA